MKPSYSAPFYVAPIQTPPLIPTEEDTSRVPLIYVAEDAFPPIVRLGPIIAGIVNPPLSSVLESNTLVPALLYNLNAFFTYVPLTNTLL